MEGAEAGLSIRCLAALSTYSTLRLELDDYLPLLCNELRKASQSCPAERLVDATSTQLHACSRSTTNRGRAALIAERFDRARMPPCEDAR